jgi:hypothetical protein
MGHVIPFPALPRPYPVRAADLNTADGVFLLAVRSWVDSFRACDDPIPRLCTAGAPDAAFSIDGLMRIVSRVVVRPIEIHCPRCPHVSLDAKQLMRAASLAQCGEGRLAEKVPRTTLLSAQGAEFAIGRLEGLGGLFARARLFLSRSHLPVAHHQSGDDQERDGNYEAWLPPRSVH